MLVHLSLLLLMALLLVSFPSCVYINIYLYNWMLHHALRLIRFHLPPHNFATADDNGNDDEYHFRHVFGGRLFVISAWCSHWISLPVIYSHAHVRSSHPIQCSGGSRIVKRGVPSAHVYTHREYYSHIYAYPACNMHNNFVSIILHHLLIMLSLLF